MSAWIPRAIVLAATVALVVIRAPHGQRSRQERVASRHAGWVERVLLAFAWVGYFVPLLWVFLQAPRFASYPAHAYLVAPGAACLVAGLVLFHRSHADLGTNWSITLEIREQHRLVTGGVYRLVRHPMYAALLLYSLGFALALPNWVAGPIYLVTMLVLFAFRCRAEEAMMLARFGQEYADYRARTKRLVPGVW